ncbi:MAG: CDP-alcohol phosphatidyltransferase family protein [Ginsengibacter sp.]
MDLIKRNKNLVNGITIYRIIAAPLLILLVIYNQIDWFKWLLAVSFFTDAIDGYLARRFKVTSIAGARLDSMGDDLTVLAGTIGLIFFKFSFLKQEMFLLIFLLALFAVQTVFALIRYGKMTGFHTYAAKTAAVLQALFLILLFFLSEPLYVLFYAAVMITAIQLMEEIIMIFWLPEWEANVKGLYWINKRNKRFKGK